MNEAIFPLLGTAFVVLIVLPLFAVLAKLGLIRCERRGGDGPLHGLNLRYLLLVGASILPLAWFLSAGLHQVEAGTSALSCLFDHDKAVLCFESGFFALALSGFIAFRGYRLFQEARRVPEVIIAPSIEGRIASLIDGNDTLRILEGRVRVTANTNVAIGTFGVFRPFVVIGKTFSENLTDEMLVGALAHEREHVRAYDPLRYLLLDVALAINPASAFMLKSHVARWHAAREAHCDREAVVSGAEPLSLADAIVRAARPQKLAVALGAKNTSVLRLRVGMLVAFSERKPTHCCREGRVVFPIAIGLLLIALMLPHRAGTAALDAIHTGAERALAHFWS
jgi:Zn-dependent protease with chaperone function